VPALRYTVRARRDLLDIWLEVSEVNPSAADDFYNRLEARVEIL
jgi:plasmid stabilization system protein ParE